jgi:hypothetical protein
VIRLDAMRAGGVTAARRLSHERAACLDHPSHCSM